MALETVERLTAIGTWLLFWTVVSAILIGASRRPEKQLEPSGEADFAETRPHKYVAVAFCVGGLVLPFYFYAKKRSLRGFLLGIGWLVLAVGAAGIVPIAVTQFAAPAPEVEILMPRDGSMVQPHGLLLFDAFARDLKDGRLSPSSLVWVMDKRRLRGSMTSFDVPPGEHELTVTATDSDGNTGRDTIHFTMAAPARQAPPP